MPVQCGLEDQLGRLQSCRTPIAEDTKSIFRPKLQDAYCRRHQIHLPPLKKRFEYHTLTLFFKMKHQMVPQYLSSLVPAPTSESSRYSFRKLSYPVPLVSKTSTLNSFLPRAIILWNSLPAAFQDIKTLAHFKFKLKSFLKLIN